MSAVRSLLVAVHAGPSDANVSGDALKNELGRARQAGIVTSPFLDEMVVVRLAADIVRNGHSYAKWDQLVDLVDCRENDAPGPAHGIRALHAASKEASTRSADLQTRIIGDQLTLLLKTEANKKDGNCTKIADAVGSIDYLLTALPLDGHLGKDGQETPGPRFILCDKFHEDLVRLRAVVRAPTTATMSGVGAAEIGTQLSFAQSARETLASDKSSSFCKALTVFATGVHINATASELFEQIHKDVENEAALDDCARVSGTTAAPQARDFVLKNGDGQWCIDWPGREVLVGVFKSFDTLKANCSPLFKTKHAANIEMVENHRRRVEEAISRAASSVFLGSLDAFAQALMAAVPSGGAADDQARDGFFFKWSSKLGEMEAAVVPQDQIPALIGIASLESIAEYNKQLDEFKRGLCLLKEADIPAFVFSLMASGIEDARGLTREVNIELLHWLDGLDVLRKKSCDHVRFDHACNFFNKLMNKYKDAIATSLCSGLQSCQPFLAKLESCEEGCYGPAFDPALTGTMPMPKRLRLS